MHTILKTELICYFITAFKNTEHILFYFRTGIKAKLSVKTAKEVDSVAEVESTGSSSVLDLDPHTTKFYVGGIPDTAQVSTGQLKIMSCGPHLFKTSKIPLFIIHYLSQSVIIHCLSSIVSHPLSVIIYSLSSIVCYMQCVSTSIVYHHPLSVTHIVCHHHPLVIIILCHYQLTVIIDCFINSRSLR